MNQSPLPFVELMPLSYAADLIKLLERWVDIGWLRALDKVFVIFLYELDPQADPLVLLAAAFTSYQLSYGHVCLDLLETLNAPNFAVSLTSVGDQQAYAVLLPSQLLNGLDYSKWHHALGSSRLVELSANDNSSKSAQSRPLVLSGKRLYLRRYWTYERRVDTALRLRIASQKIVPADLPQRLNNMFNQSLPSGVIDWQKLACAIATCSSFSVITGGPGTGKTTIVVRLLALLQEPAVKAGSPLRIRLAAPTGKAAACLAKSISQQLNSLNVSLSIRESITTQVTTIHRLLGSYPNTRHFRHNISNPLLLDMLVVDEASMIDLEMMANLLDALPSYARLVLLGDKYQLASVEAGAVFSNLCRDAEADGYSPATCQWLQAISGKDFSINDLQEYFTANYSLAQQVIMLRYSRRFSEISGIGQLAFWVNQQNVEEACKLLVTHSHKDLFYLRLKNEHDDAFIRLVIDGHNDKIYGYRYYLSLLHSTRPALDTSCDDIAWIHWAQQLLYSFDAFRLLCVVRKGSWGVEQLNLRITTALRKLRLITGNKQWYEGRPVLITSNDYCLGLMNGDIGIALKLPESGCDLQVLRVAFPRNNGQAGVRFVLPSRLNDIETAYAMTVHKSQGSEFAHTALILPDTLHSVLTKELIYTGITRAKHWFSLIEPRSGIFEEAIRRKVKRVSGLMLELSATPNKTY
ncbi:exodeoxyribonuclease V subunit alpha [Candidatus Pseudomonas adelgestsugas]|uniref:RecBCD enzyme subunit RecD n=1 Tax=Candidatus Pseudomonas adelgestsugas TaxID=1302376 RepID=A0ABX5R9F8_9PSED|nr:exodeoxyribonuclease V subunit alpha [Candidatus Pseudomonas adelgestsugas]QAX82285.1 RecBCD enzyme subunit RecD [Candidatus Pseudomonas adelgestsugas]